MGPCPDPASLVVPLYSRPVLLLLSLLTLIATASGDPMVHASGETDLAQLANDPTWKRLLHVTGYGSGSIVLSDDFYLSTNGRSEPLEELRATLKAFEQPWGADTNAHPRCRFPARYLWLSSKLELTGYKPRDPRCSHLEKWALLDQVKSVSLYLIGGYFGNPASTFGHTVLKVNTEEEGTALGLFDLTVSYGAKVPENEFVPRYIVKGLLGGYDAAFTDRYFYAQDLVYSRTEFRDIWDYKLRLSETQRTLLILHIWEVLGKLYDYYFLQRNCAFRLAELLELVIPEDLSGNGYVWYPPNELFFRLKELDRDEKNAGGAGIIDSVTFIPSTQRQLLFQLRRLTTSTRRAFDTVVEEGITNLDVSIASVSYDQQFELLDALLAYHDYRLIAAGDAAPSELKGFRDKVLLARLRLPARKNPVSITPLPSPIDGTESKVFGIGVGYDGKDSVSTRLNLAAFKLETVGKNSLEGDELVVADLSLGAFEERNEVFLERLDALRVLNLDVTGDDIADSSGLSWGLRIGSERVRRYQDSEYDGLLQFGAGKAIALYDSLIAYTLVDVAAHSAYDHLRTRPHLGARLDFGTLKAHAFYGAESQEMFASLSDVWGGKIQWQANQRSSLNLEASSATSTRFNLSLNWYF